MVGLTDDVWRKFFVREFEPEKVRPLQVLEAKFTST